MDHCHSPYSCVASYDILITQTINENPKTRVLAPSLRPLAGGAAIPHLYNQEKQVLCLYLPAAAEFDGRRPIGPQILPWAATWLYYFEEWLVSGEWSGGGIHPDMRRRSETEHPHPQQTS